MTYSKKRAYLHLIVFYRNRYILDCNHKIILCKSLVLSQSNYCDVTYRFCLTFFWFETFLESTEFLPKTYTFHKEIWQNFSYIGFNFMSASFKEKLQELVRNCCSMDEKFWFLSSYYLFRSLQNKSNRRYFGFDEAIAISCNFEKFVKMVNVLLMEICYVMILIYRLKISSDFSDNPI